MRDEIKQTIKNAMDIAELPETPDKTTEISIKITNGNLSFIMEIIQDGERIFKYHIAKTEEEIENWETATQSKLLPKTTTAELESQRGTLAQGGRNEPSNESHKQQ